MEALKFTSNQVTKIIAGVALTLAILAASATGAQAAAYKIVGTDGHGLNVRTAPSLSAGLVRNLPDGTAINIECQTRGDAVVGSTMWDKISQPVAGYVADWYTSTPVVNNPSPGLPACSTPLPLPPPNPQPAPNPTVHQPSVAENALAYNGQTVIPAGFASHYHLGHYWSGYCEAFVALVAYNGQGHYGTALADYQAHKRIGEVHTTGTPPAGAVVYWNPEHNNVGHVGISIGGGSEISTYGFAGQHYPIQVHPYRYFGDYLGWAMP